MSTAPPVDNLSDNLQPEPDLRERALYYGVASLSDAELVALLLGTGVGGQSVQRLAAALLEDVGEARGLLRLGPLGLAERRGVGPAKATRIAAAVELGRRATFEPSAAQHPPIHCFDAVVRWAKPRLAHLDHEEVWLLTLDGKHALRSAKRIAQGGQHGCALTPKDVLSPALRDAASAIVVIHNHPSGDSAPSPEDLHMTRGLASASSIVGLPLLDHVIVGRTEATSLAALGWL